MGKANTLRAVAAGAGVTGAAWILDGHLWALGVLAGCAILTALAVLGLKRWSDGKIYADRRPLEVRAEQVRYVAPDLRPAIVIPASIESNEP